jgi:hypothetical protein
VFNFQHGRASFRLKSDAFEWLLVSGNTAWLKGSGTLNDSGNYVFLLAVAEGNPDGTRPRGRGKDKIRIQIADKTTGALIYDSAPWASNPMSDTALQTILEGQIEIHER